MEENIGGKHRRKWRQSQRTCNGGKWAGSNHGRVGNNAGNNAGHNDGNRGKGCIGTRAARFSGRNAVVKDGKDCWNAWATSTAIKVPEATVKMPTESLEDGGSDVEGAGNKSDERLLNIGRVVGVLRKLETTDETSQQMRKRATMYSDSKRPPNFQRKTLKGSGKTPMSWGKQC